MSQPVQPVFNPNAPHQQRPKLRPVRVFPAEVAGQQLMGIADARQVSERAVVTSPAAQFVLPMLDGNRGLDEVITTVGRGLTRPILEQLVAQLDDAGLLEGPVYQAMIGKIHSEFDGAPTLPPGSTAAMADAMAASHLGSQEKFEALSAEEKAALGAERMRFHFDEWMSMALKDAEKPSFDALPRAVVAPHLDYPRGWVNYGATWGRLRVVDRPDRVIILGTNHFGEGTGVTGCPKGYESPLGVCGFDQRFADALGKNLGSAHTDLLYKNRFDHEREHSIELQIPWVQHCLGRGEGGVYPAVFAALVHDPAANNGESYDGKGLGLQPFVEAMSKTVASMPGRTLIVSSADLSHVGPGFGDQMAMAGDDPQVVEARNNVFRHDQDMLRMLVNRTPDEMISAMSWQGNATRWCSLGNLVAACKIADPERVELLSYSGAMDPEGTTLVTSASMVMA
ncbi:MAG: AmmeMemoRadiSam system protein B [Phycisphaerales bacterium]